MSMDPVELELALAQVPHLVERIEKLEKVLAEREAVDARRSSIEVGHADKGGLLKVYTDPYGDTQANIDAVNEQRYLLAMAGGVPKASTLTKEEETKLLGRVNKKPDTEQTAEGAK